MYVRAKFSESMGHGGVQASRGWEISHFERTFNFISFETWRFKKKKGGNYCYRLKIYNFVRFFFFSKKVNVLEQRENLKISLRPNDTKSNRHGIPKMVYFYFSFASYFDVTKLKKKKKIFYHHYVKTNFF